MHDRQPAKGMRPVHHSERNSHYLSIRNSERLSVALMPCSRLPAFCTSMGHVLLAALTEEEAWARLGPMDARTPHTITDPEVVMARIASARTDGYAQIDQEVEIGRRSIAVPLMDIHGRIVAAMNIGLHATQGDVEDLAARYLTAVQVIQSEIR